MLQHIILQQEELLFTTLDIIILIIIATVDSVNFTVTLISLVLWVRIKTEHA